MLRFNQKLVTMLVTSICLLLLPGVASAAQSSPSRIVLQLKWTHLFQFAGYYAAVEKGYYREAGLDVSFLEAGPDVNPVAVVLAGKAAFGVGTSELLLHRVAGDKVVVLAAIFQHSPLAIMTMRDGPIQNIQDLSGRRIMIEPGSAELFAYLRKESVSKDRLTIVSHTHKVEDLLTRKVDAMSVYDTEEPYTARLAGAKVNLFSARSVGIDFYGDCLFTSEDFIARNPETVRKFRDASIRGWRYALANQSEMVDLIRTRYLPERKREQLVYEAEKTSQLVRADLVEIGYMSPGRWRHIAETYAELGMIPRDVSLEGFLYQQEPPPINKGLLFGIVGTSLLAIIALAGLLRYVSLNRRLRRTEALYNSILDASPDGIMITDLEGRIRMASNKALVMAGVERDINPTGQNVLEYLVPEDRERARTNIGIKFEGADSGPNEYRAIKADGSILDIEANAGFVRDTDGKATGMVIVSRDISERKLAEEALRSSQERYRAIMDQSFEALCLVDIHTQEVVEVNRRFAELTGYSLPADAPLYVSEFIVDTQQSLDRAYREMLQHQRVIPTATRVVRHKNGIELFVERAGTVINVDGRDIYLASMRDMTKERRRQAELTRDVELATRVQRGLLPELPESPFVDIQTLYHPANFVSGDSYFLEWRNEGKLLRGFITDVSGHGLGTAIQTASINVLLRESSIVQWPLIDQVRWINTHAAKYFTDGAYAAMLGFELDLSLHELRYVGAGITQFRANGKKIETPGMFVGLWDNAEFTTGSISLAEGDCFCFLTDGFTDALAQPEHADFWSPDGRGFDADVAALQRLAGSGGLRDDATGVCIKIKNLAG